MTPPAKPLQPAYDAIIVGGGAAGCVVARRLAEDPATRVLLIEAGPPDTDPAIADTRHWTALLRGRYDWGYDYAPSPHTNGRTIAIPRGRVLGGSSSINAVTWYRGHPSDYDAWEDAGAEGWGYEAVLPHFRRSEDWEGGANLWRGAGGPIRIERPRNPHPIALAMLDGAAQLGLPVLDDPNGASNEGAALGNYNVRGERRCSAADGYLRPAADWPNLTILTGSLAIALVFDGRRCTGVRHLVDGVPVTTRAEAETILTLGAIDTPRLLLLSGIGGPADLARLGIPVRAALPGVGQNLQDHPLIMGMNFRARAPLGPVRGNAGGSMMNWRSRPDLPAPDLHAFVVQGPHAGPEIGAAYDLSGDVFAISPGLMRSRSVGYLRLLDPAPGGRMEIQPNFLADPADLDALAAGVEMIADLADTPAYRPLIAATAAPDRRLTRTERNAFVRQSVATFFHPVGTCSIGAVVDPQLRVLGVDGLRVADASVMPVIPSCNTLAPTVMIAERAASFIRQEGLI
jgi:choline dehydrogenase